MTRTRVAVAPNTVLMAKALLAAAALAAALAIAPPVFAQADPVLATARSAGVVGEQADGFVGIVSGQNASADVRARVDALNIRRRAAYTTRATERGVTVNEMAAAVACEIFQGRVAVGERYRDEGGTWRQRTASAPVAMPSFCPN